MNWNWINFYEYFRNDYVIVYSNLYLLHYGPHYDITGLSKFYWFMLKPTQVYDFCIAAPHQIKILVWPLAIA